jgi:hypothetical protein
MRVSLDRRPVTRRQYPSKCIRTPLARSSTPWRTGIGAGFAIGATQRVLELVTHEEPRHYSYGESGNDA